MPENTLVYASAPAVTGLGLKLRFRSFLGQYFVGIYSSYYIPCTNYYDCTVYMIKNASQNWPKTDAWVGNKKYITDAWVAIKKN